MPAIGISIRNIPKDSLIRLIQGGHEIFVSYVTIFELSAKGAKYATLQMIPPERILRGIRAITYDDKLNIIDFHETKILLTAFKLRNIINDFIDCLILSSAINRCDVLLTEDSEMQNIEKDKIYQEILMPINPKFKIHRLTDFVGENK